MTTEVWFRNPSSYIRELVEEEASRIIWFKGLLVKRAIDPVKFAKMYFPAHIPHRTLVVEHDHAPEYRAGDSLDKPCAVYPVWNYGEDIAVLEEMMYVNIADVPGACSRTDVPPEQRPVLGQEHRVLVNQFPEANIGPGRRFLRQLQELQEDYPDCIVHVVGLYSFRMAFGLGFGAADVEVRTHAHKGQVLLPNGKVMKHAQTVKCPQWVTMLGMSPVDLQTPKNRCKYNIRSALWAGQYFTENIKFKSTGKHEPDTTSAVAVPPTTSGVVSNHKSAVAGDKYLCDTCSLQDSCKYYRSGGVCSIPGSEPASLARLMKTRDAETLIDGLGTLLAVQATRVERGLEDEEMTGELDPEVTKIINSAFGNGVKLAKLLNPALAGGPKVGVFVNGGNASVVANATPKQMVAAVVAELEARGIERDKITPEMIEGLLNPEATREAIDAVVVEESA